MGGRNGGNNSDARFFSRRFSRVYANFALSATLGPACSGGHSPRSGLPPARVRRPPLKGHGDFDADEGLWAKLQSPAQIPDSAHMNQRKGRKCERGCCNRDPAPPSEAAHAAIRWTKVRTLPRCCIRGELFPCTIPRSTPESRQLEAATTDDLPGASNRRPSTPESPRRSSKSYEVVTNVVKTRDKDTMHVCDVRLK